MVEIMREIGRPVSGIVALVEHEAGRPDRLSLEALTIAGRLGTALGTPVHAALFGAGADVTAAGLGAFGVATAHVIAHDRLDAYAPAAWAVALGQVVDAGSFDAVVAPGSERGTEVLAHLAARAGSADGRERRRRRAGRAMEGHPAALGRQPARRGMAGR